MKISQSAQGHIVILATNIIFGINTPIAKDALNTLNTLAAGSGPYVLTTFRFFGCALIFWLLSGLFHIPEASKKDTPKLLLASFFGITFNLFLFIIGLSKTTPTNASILVSMTPIFTMILAAVFLGEPVTFKKVAGVITGLTGAMILIMTRSGSGAAASDNLMGIIICLLSSVAYATYLTLFRDLIKRNHPITVMKWMFLMGSIAILPFTLRHMVSLPYNMLSLKTIGELSYVVIFATCLNYIFIPIGQSRLRPTVLSMYNYVQPVITTAIAVAVGMEMFSFAKVIACILVFEGVYIVTKSRAKSQQ